MKINEITRVQPGRNFYRFKNKIDLTNQETFSFFPSGEAFNNELYIYLNKKLFDGVENGKNKPFKSQSLFDYNFSKDENKEVNIPRDYYSKFYINKQNPTNKEYFFYDTSMFDWKQPTLTDYFEYRGDIFELFERMNQIVAPKIEFEQESKLKYLEWFDVDFLREQVGIKRISKTIFNPKAYTKTFTENIHSYGNDKEYNTNTREYFKYVHNKNTVNEVVTDQADFEMYLTANSNSVVPARIYYKKTTTHTAANEWSYHFMIPFYLVDIDTIETNSGVNVLNKNERIVNINSIKRPESFDALK